jgi:hypothetical protein
MKPEALIQRNSLTSDPALFSGTSVSIRSLFDFLQDNQTVETFLDHFPTIAPEQVLAVLTKSRDMLLDASLDSDDTQLWHPESAATEYLVCKSCRDPIYAIAGGRSYLHAYTGSPKCIAPLLPKVTEATPYDDNQTYASFRAELIADMTRAFHSYSEVDSPEELLEMLLADARHFADAKRLHFDDHYRRSQDLYLENTTGERR